METVQQKTVKDYGNFLADAGIPYSVNGSFLQHGEPAFDRRWLICLSICLRDTEQILANVLPVLIEYDVPFMLIKDQLQHNRINNHAFPPALFGKPLIAFPGDLPQAIRLAAALARATDAFEGVFIPGAIRLGSIVYAVYAEQPFALYIPDSDIPPFPASMVRKEATVRRFIKRRYLPLSLVRSSHKGNILKGWDLWKLKAVFIKQANAWAAEDDAGRTMRNRLLWQREVYQKTHKAIRTPKVLDFVEQDGYSYLITEYLDGKTLDQLIPEVLKEPEGLYTLLGYYYEALYLVSFFHDAGYIHRDLTAGNILICEGKVYLTDLELAHPLHNNGTPPYASGSFGYMSPQQRRNEPPTVADDVYAMGALLYYIVSGEKPDAWSLLPEGEREARLKQLDAPDELKWLMTGSLKEDPNERMALLDLLQDTEGFLTGYYLQQAPVWRKARKKRAIRKLIISAALMILAGLTVTLMWLVSDEPNSHPNGFTRKFLSNDLVPLTEITVPKDTRYIAGLVGDSLYFSTLTPGEVAVLHLPTRKMTARFIVKDPALLSRLHASNVLKVDRFGAAIYDGNSRLLVLEQPGGQPKTQYASEIFTRVARLSRQSVVLRKFKPGERDQYLYRFDLAKNNSLDESRVTEPANDGGLVTDGILECDPLTGQCLYITRYANHMTRMDTDLRVIETGHTIDTFRNYILGSRKVDKGKGFRITNAGPEKYVNMDAVISNGQIYVYSYVKADNETFTQFMNGNVIDVYLATGLSYAGSYRLATEGKKRIRNFKVQGDRLYVLMPGLLKIYRLPAKKQALKIAGS